MSTTIQDEVAEILDRVGPLPEEARRHLAAKIAGTFTEAPAPPKPRGNLANLIGLLKTDGPPPTDEEIERMLHEEKMRRLGP